MLGKGIVLVVDGARECTAPDAVTQRLEATCLYHYQLTDKDVETVVTFRDEGVCKHLRFFRSKWKARSKTVKPIKSKDALRLIRAAVKMAQRHRVKVIGLHGPRGEGLDICNDLREAAYSLGIEVRIVELPLWAFEKQLSLLEGT